MVKECVHIDTGRYYAAKVINKRMMAGREHMVPAKNLRHGLGGPSKLMAAVIGSKRDCSFEEGINGPSKHTDAGGLL